MKDGNLCSDDLRCEIGDHQGASAIAAAVCAILSLPDDALDYCRAKLTFDGLVDPASTAIDVEWQLDRLLTAAQELAGPAAGPDARLAALRRAIYEAGPWNDHRPFAYDLTDPEGRHIPNKLLANYLTTRRGQCVSMPTLFLILADRLGLEVALATAPEHLFVRYRDEQGRVLNLETTSGAHPARDAWIRERMPMSDRAVASGLYLRTLSKREGVAQLALTVVEHAFEREWYETARTVSMTILEHAPPSSAALTSYGVACNRLIKREFVDRFPFPPMVVPPALRPRCLALIRGERGAFARAEALGWEEPEPMAA